jgi:hypothetical protein
MIADTVDHNYYATGTVTVAGQTITFTDEEIESVAKLFGDPASGAASHMWCHPTDDVLFLDLAGYAFQTFEPAP